MVEGFQVGNAVIGGGSLFLIAGPCVIESADHALRMAEIIKGVTRSLSFPFIFKASYDKANRTSIGSFRGPGVAEGLRILRRVKDEVGVPILTDVHETADVPKVAEVAVAGLSDERWGQIVVAFVVPADPALTADELDQFCLANPHLARFKRPRRYVFVKKVPKSAVGKILRRKLQAGDYQLYDVPIQ